VCWCPFRIPSSPARAVATPRNSPPSLSPPKASTSTRRVGALSSATSTGGRGGGSAALSDDVDIGSDRPDLDAAILDVKPDAAAALAADRFSDDRDRRGAQGAARRQEVALAHLNRPGGDQLAEHAGAARELGDEPAR